MKDPRICVTLRCSRPKATGRTLCHRCKAQREKEINPLAYTYSRLKQNAKRRGKIFTITIKEFRQFVAGTRYMELKGRGATNLSIDRKDNSKGYEAGNLQILTVSENIRKQYVSYFQQQLPL